MEDKEGLLLTKEEVRIWDDELLTFFETDVFSPSFELETYGLKVAQAQLSKVLNAGYKSPEEVDHYIFDAEERIKKKYAGYLSPEEVEELKHQIEAKDTLLALQGDKLNALLRERNGEVWYWLGDGNDHPESLCCPILIEPEDILKFEAKIEEAKKQERERIFNFQLKALQGDYIDALDCQSEYDNDPNWTELQKKEHHDYWRGQSGAIAKIIDGIQALKSPDKGE